MENIENEAFQFHRYRRIDGAVEPVNLIRRNGRPEIHFPPGIVEFPLYTEAEENPEYRELVDEVCQNLNEIERRTWMKIIDGKSILQQRAIPALPTQLRRTGSRPRRMKRLEIY